MGVDSDSSFDTLEFANAIGSMGTFLLMAPSDAHWPAGLIERHLQVAGHVLAKLPLMCPEMDLEELVEELEFCITPASLLWTA